MDACEVSEEEYDAFAREHPCATFLNSIYAGRRFKERGWSVVYVAGKKENVMVAAALLVSTSIRGGKYFYAPRGFLLDYHNTSILMEFGAFVKRYCKERNALYLKIDPYFPYQEHDVNGAIIEDGFHYDMVVECLKNMGYQHQGFNVGYNPATQNRWMSILRLEHQKEEDIMEAMIPARRRMLKNGLRRGVHVRELKYEELHILQDVMDATCARQGFSDMPEHYYEECMKIYGTYSGACAAYLNIDEYLEDIHKELLEQKQSLIQTEEKLRNTPDSKKMCNRQKQCQEKISKLQTQLDELLALKKQKGNEIILSAAFYFNYAKEFVYLSGGSYDEYMNFRGSYAIQWYMIRKAIETGCHVYNFYGISGYFEKEQEGYGVFDFKRGFHAEVIELLGDFILPLKPFTYTMIQKFTNFKNNLHRLGR